MDLELSVVPWGSRTVIRLRGEVDVSTAPQLRQQITSLVNDGCYDLVIDLDEVEFLDSTALSVLVGGLKAVRSFGGSLQLVCSNPLILRPFQITGLNKVFFIFDSLESLIASGTTPPHVAAH